MALLTIVCDQNPELGDAIDALAPFIANGCVKDARPAIAMGDAMECDATPNCRAVVVEKLNAAGFRIVEGGQR